MRSEKIQERNEGGFLVIEPLAPLDSKLSPALLQLGSLHLRKGVTHLAIDLGQTPFLTSLGFSVLLQLHKSIGQRNGSMVLFGLTPEAHEALAASRLDSILQIARDAQEAVAFLNESSP